MLAEQYGYWVSESTASTARPTRRWLQGAPEREAAAEKKFGVGCLFASGVPLGLMLLIGVSSDNPTLMVALFSGVGVLISLGSLLRQPTRDPKKLFPALYEKKWQAWPCRVEAPAPTGARVTATVTLLGPAQEAVRRFHGRVPAATWHRMTDGYGVLWVCGDLRLPVHMADPGGAPVWHMGPEKGNGDAASSSATPEWAGAAAEEAVREASAAATQQWLEEMGW